MENASKALLMAASILVGIVLLSVIVYFWTSINSYSKDYDSKISMQKINEFNAPFLAIENRKNISPHEVVSLANKANTINNPDTVLGGYYNGGEALSPTDAAYIHIYVTFNHDTIDIANVNNYPNKTEYNGKPDKFINDLLDGTFVSKYYSFMSNFAQNGEYKYEYVTPSNKVYYNCYECTGVTINPNTKRVQSVSFVYRTKV